MLQESQIISTTHRLQKQYSSPC